jgi:hypothetical protein
MLTWVKPNVLKVRHQRRQRVERLLDPLHRAGALYEHASGVHVLPVLATWLGGQVRATQGHERVDGDVWPEEPRLSDGDDGGVVGGDRAVLPPVVAWKKGSES